MSKKAVNKATANKATANNATAGSAAAQEPSVSPLKRYTFSPTKLKDCLESLGPECSILLKYFIPDPKSKYVLPLKDSGYPSFHYLITGEKILCLFELKMKEKDFEFKLSFTFRKNGQYYDKPDISAMISSDDKSYSFNINISDEIYTSTFPDEIYTSTFPVTEIQALEMVESFLSYFGLIAFFSTIFNRRRQKFDINKLYERIGEKINKKYNVEESEENKEFNISIGKEK
jgi:hypothetical protein